jgi:hypothetical protein
MGEVIDLQSQLAQLEDNQEFVADLCRFSEEILTENQVRRKYHLAESSWSILGENDSLVEKIEAEKIRRIRDGSSKRERAQLLVVKAPDVLGGIMNSADANDRHRIDACKTLNDFAANGPAGVPAADRFQIVINLGADLEGKPIVEKYDKSIAIDVNDVDPNHIVDTPHGPWPVIAANKRKDDGGNGEPL